jgi:hypothetical protein
MTFLSANMQNAVCMSLADDNEAELNAGTGCVLHDVMLPSVLIHTGMELEEAQYVSCSFPFLKASI